MIIAALALDRLDDDGADVDLAPLSGVDVSADLFFCFFLARDHIFLALGFRQSEIDVGTGNARPIEFREQIRLARIGIGEAHGVAAAAVEGVTEMQNLSAAFAVTGRHVFPHLPIHRRFQRVLDCERAPFDEQIFFERRQSGNARKSLHKFSVGLRINIRVRHFRFGRAQKIALHIRLIEIGMIKSNRHRPEKTVKIDQAVAVGRVVKI